MNAATTTAIPSGDVITRTDRFIDTSGEINGFIKIYSINLTEQGLQQVGKRLYAAKVAVMGSLANKKYIKDAWESPANTIIEELVYLGADVQVYDPFALSIRTKAEVLNPR